MVANTFRLLDERAIRAFRNSSTPPTQSISLGAALIECCNPPRVRIYPVLSPDGVLSGENAPPVRIRATPRGWGISGATDPRLREFGASHRNPGHWVAQTGATIESGGRWLALAEIRAARGHGSWIQVGPVSARAPSSLAALAWTCRAAPTTAPVVIEGASGTGKELYARLVHELSDRRSAPAVPVNCAAIANSLADSELFGHTKGAFTGAVAASQGLFRAADGSTLFLDEIGELPPMLQAKLLRVLESGEVRPVGDANSTTVDVRLVAATNRDLQRLGQTGSFRQDLLYRLRVFAVQLAPLCERKEELPALVFALSSAKPHRHVAQWTPEAWAALRGHDWPGNVRELRNALARLRHVSVASVQRVMAAHVEQALCLGSGHALANSRYPARQTAAEAEWPDDSCCEDGRVTDEVIRDAIRLYDGNKKAAYESLNMSKSTFYRKCRQMKEQLATLEQAQTHPTR